MTYLVLMLLEDQILVIKLKYFIYFEYLSSLCTLYNDKMHFLTNCCFNNINYIVLTMKLFFIKISHCFSNYRTTSKSY